MKTIVQSLVAALLFSTATLASDVIPASTNPTVTTNSYKVVVYPAITPNKLNVIVERQPGQMMVVSMKDSNGHRLGQQLVDKKQGTFRFQFDLSALQDGNYSVEVISGNDVALYPVTLKTQSAQETTRTITLN
ncbi:hypothetical protein GCM10028806_58140 [Spirosoma terrae]|uniref:T9SS type A sorting domain-containing protein n=1 Tax=Spirosoma terrae TaxID=1968276 RepID=A0A6L9LBY8_9BACT|nr:hypothetical protein [Spirosoma terrae]NDU98036.1 hypothetical protein [Spirosoma terrae]